MGKITTVLLGTLFLLFSYPELTSDITKAYKVYDIMTSNTEANSRSKKWDPGKTRVLEVSGIECYDKKRLILTTRKGDVLILHNPDKAHQEPPQFTVFASGLHEPLGIVKRGKSFFIAQRSELTELIDQNGDDVADAYLCHARPWDISGNYHEYAYGPKLDNKGQLWVTLNLGMGKLSNSSTIGRGWGVKITPQGKSSFIAAGMRSPSGLGLNQHHDVFFTDQQGNYVPTNTLHHLRQDAFFGHPDALNSAKKMGSKLMVIKKKINNVPYPQALKTIPSLVAPSIWFPYIKMGRSATDVVCNQTQGKFGPFENQLFIGEFTHSGINRVFLEKVNGEYQGACFPFMRGFPAGVVRLQFSKDGSLYVGMTNRGWNSTGGASFGLHRVEFKETPFEILKMQVKATGFKVTFTKPVSKKQAMSKDSYKMINYTYHYSNKYGGEEILTKENEIESIKWINQNTIELVVKDLVQYHVHELICKGVVDTEGNSLSHPDVYYTLNQIPK